MTYKVSFSSSAYQPLDRLDTDREYSLEEVIEICIDNQCSADLYDEPGFRKGKVDSDGNYNLT